MFKEYKSKPVISLAHKISEEDILTAVDETTMKIEFPDKSAVNGVLFKHLMQVNVGDYVCFLNNSDIFHCNAKVFAERNIVGEENV